MNRIRRLFDKVFRGDDWWEEHSENWKVNISGIDEKFEKSAVLKYHNAVKKDAIINLTRVGNSAQLSSGFTLNKPAKFKIYALGEGFDGEITIAEIQQGKPWRSRAAIKIKLAYWFLNHSEPVEIEGTAVNLTKNMLIVSTTEDQIRVHLPPEWTVGNELIQREELFASGYLSEGENITVKALEANLIDKEGLRIYLLVGYEIINESGVHAYANLPINIED